MSRKRPSKSPTSAPASDRRAAAPPAPSSAIAARPQSSSPPGAAMDETLPRPIHRLIQRGEDDPLIFQQLAEVIRLGQRDVLAQRYAHNPSSWLFSHTRYVYTNLPIIAGRYRQSSSGSPVSPGSPAASSRTARSCAPESRK